MQHLPVGVQADTTDNRRTMGEAAEYAGWVLDAQNGDGGAFDRLQRVFEHAALGWARARLIGHHDSVRDAVQDAFLEAFISLRALRDPRAFPAWLRLLVNKHCDRVTRRSTPMGNGAPPVDLCSEADGEHEGADAYEALRHRIDRLPPAQRGTAARLLAGYGQREIATLLGERPGTIRKRWHDAQESLREALGRAGTTCLA